MCGRLTGCLMLAVLTAQMSACFLAPDSNELWSDIDVAAYDVLPVLPATSAHTYWDAFVASDEYSYSEMTVDDRVIAADGAVCTVSPCIEDYESYRVVDNAVKMLCPPAGCWLYMARIRGDTLIVAKRDRDWVALFAPYDSKERAAAFVRRRGFHWRSDDTSTGLIRERGGIYELIVLRGSTCGGDVRRYQLTVSPPGTLDTLRSQLYERGDPTCAI